MSQKAKMVGRGQLDNGSRRPDFKPSTQESNVVSLPTPTFPCANTTKCKKSTHGWGTVDGDKHVCSKKCHDEYLAEKEKGLKTIRKTMELVVGPDGIVRPANLPTKAEKQK